MGVERGSTWRVVWSLTVVDGRAAEVRCDDGVAVAGESDELGTGAAAGESDAASGVEAVASRWKMEERRRSLCCLRRSRRRRAQTYSAARIPRPRRMVSKPGPGRASMIMPSASRVKPKRIVRKRLACWSDLIMGRVQALSGAAID